MNMKQRAALSMLVTFMPERQIKLGRVVKIVSRMQQIIDSLPKDEQARVDLRELLMIVIDDAAS